jgi:hypothetical protein
MRLSELDPRWFEIGDQRAGFTFLCPHCKTTRLACNSVPIGTADPQFCWTITGADWNMLTVAPSIDASKSGHWHGHITNGEIK